MQKVWWGLALIAFITACTTAAQTTEPTPKPQIEQPPPPPKKEVVVEEPKAAPGPFTVAIVADLNSSYGSYEYTPAVHAAAAYLAQSRPDLVLSAGDMVAGQKRGLDYPGMWSAFHHAFTDPVLSAGLTLAVTPGNHDGAKQEKFAVERREFVNQWQPRKPDLEYVSDEHYPLMYAFQKRGVLFISLDATTPGKLSPMQHAWLESILSKSDEFKSTIVYGHVPLVQFAAGRGREVLGDAKLRETLHRYKVDAYITGHHHAYYPARDESLLMLGAPCLGTGPRPLTGHTQKSQKGLLWLTFAEDGSFQYEARIAPDFTSTIAVDELPEKLKTKAGTVVRD